MQAVRCQKKPQSVVQALWSRGQSGGWTRPGSEEPIALHLWDLPHLHLLSSGTRAGSHTLTSQTLGNFPCCHSCRDYMNSVPKFPQDLQAFCSRQAPHPGPCPPGRAGSFFNFYLDSGNLHRLHSKWPSQDRGQGSRTPAIPWAGVVCRVGAGSWNLSPRAI